MLNKEEKKTLARWRKTPPNSEGPSVTRAVGGRDGAMPVIAASMKSSSN